jgi:hypothetical protein
MRTTWSWLAVALSSWASLAAAEELTLTTYYPSPRGVYRELRTTHNTYLAQYAGTVLVGTRRLTNDPGLGVPKFLVTGVGVNPVGGACPAQTNWYDENNSGLPPENGECKPAGLAVGGGGRVFLGQLPPTGLITGRLHIRGLPLTGALAGVDGGLVLQRTGASQAIGAELWQQDGVQLASLGLAGQAGHWSLQSQPGDLILRVRNAGALHLATNLPTGVLVNASAHTTRLFLSSSGRLGLGDGVTDPQARLHVVRQSTTTPLFSVADAASLRVDDQPGGDATPFLIDATGRVGVGTATPAAQLHVVQPDASHALRVDDAPGDSSPFVVDAAGRVGIGTTNPQGALDVQSTSAAFVPPRMTEPERNGIASPAVGSMVYNLTSNQLEIFRSGAWGPLTGGGGGMQCQDVKKGGPPLCCPAGWSMVFCNGDIWFGNCCDDDNDYNRMWLRARCCQ